MFCHNIVQMGKSLHSCISYWIYFGEYYGHNSAGYWHRKYREHWEISHREVQRRVENELIKNTRMSFVHG